MEDFLSERYELVTECICRIKEENALPRDWQEYFAIEAEYVERACEYLAFVQSGGLEKATRMQLQEWNQHFNKKVQSVKGDCAALAESVSEELRSLSFLAAQGRFEEFLIRLELFAEFYGICVCEWQEEKKLPDYKILYDCLYWYASDYADMVPLQELRYLQKPEESSVYQGLLMWDLEEDAYLYRYGTIITDRERNLFEWLKELSVEEIESWAQKLAEEVRELVEEMETASGKRILLQYPVGYEKLIYALMKRLREHGVEVIPEIAGKEILFSLFEIDFAESKLWDKALAKRCREIRQTIAEKAERESLFGIIKVVLKEDKKEILKPHVV